MAAVCIVGGGAFGTALACVARRPGHAVRLWAREPEVVEDINLRRENRRFLPGCAIDAGIEATNDLAHACGGADLVLMAPPAQHMREVARQLRPALPAGIPVASCSKGIERGSGALMPQVLAETLPRAPIAVLSGPSFAAEIARDLPCAVLLACADREAGARIAAALGSPRFAVHRNGDVTGAAVAGSMKNVVSILSGVAHGLALGENARATLVTLGLEEAARLGVMLGARRETFLGLAGAGDFMLTAMSLKSRNTSLGIALGEGKSLEEALAGRTAVTEGVASVEAVALLARRWRIRMPVTRALEAILHHGAAPGPVVASLFA